MADEFANPLAESGVTIRSDSEQYSQGEDLSASPPSSSSPVILYKPPTVWSLLRGAAINLFLPFINGMMLGFGELFAHEAAFRLGWGGTKVFPTTRRAHAIGPGLEIREKRTPRTELDDLTKWNGFLQSDYHVTAVVLVVHIDPFPERISGVGDSTEPDIRPQINNMLPSRGALRSLSTGRAYLQAQTTSRLSNGRQFGTTSRIASTSWSGLRPTGKTPGLVRTTVVAGSLSSTRTLSLWSRGPKTEAAPAPATTPEVAAVDTTAPAATTASIPPPEAAVASTTPSFAEGVASAPTPVTDASTFELLTDTTIAQMPEQIGYLKAIGLDFGYGPSSCMQWILEHVYIYTGLPWWATIGSTVLLLRLLLLKPTLNAQQGSAKMQQLQGNAQYAALKQKMQDSMKSGDNYGLFIVLNNMAKIPVPSLENGGLLWFNDLSVSDPFFILPVAAPIAMVAMLKSGTKFAPVQQQAQMKLMMYIFVPLSLIFTIWLPAAVQFYFLCSTLVGWGQNLLFQNPAFRRATGLPELVRPVLPASTSRISGAMFYPPTKRTGSTDANTIDVTAVEEKPKNVFSGAVADLKQTVHGAKGGMGSFVDQARQEQAEKSNKSWEEKRAEEDKRRFKSDLKRRAK
ncbi:hypothetical protein BN1723_005897 [Verticillium longisporum]|uniref:Uncharacterized protein n=1 Tax=Verticillium longisporum TaxID=100787 RepID=A0A0G4NBR9_VERLO|nr:hypothetical protein BN1723_005897 [Verticillium longisporum]